MKHFVSVSALLVLVGANPSRALVQTALPTFEVASVRAQTERLDSAFILGNGPWVRPGGAFSVKATTIQTLMTFAFGVEPYQVVGGPDWMRRDMFAIEARAGRDATESEIKLMLQSLLQDRFKLVSHTEEREMRVRALVLANAEGRLGPYMQRMADPCTAADSAEARKRFPPRAETTGRSTTTSASCSDLTSMVRGFNLLAVRDPQFSQVPLVDKTGLTGRFTYEVRYVVPDGIESFTAMADALEEQLGLEFVTDRAVITVRVIDSIERPSEN